MESRTFTVPNISCGHCTNTIETEVAGLPGVAKVEANKENKQVTVAWDSPASWEQILSTLHEINFPPAE